MMRAARNVLIGAGAFYVSRWLEGVLRVAVGAVLHALIARGPAAHALVPPLVDSLSTALAAAAAGIATAWLVDSRRPVPWTLVPAALWLLASLNGAPFSPSAPLTSVWQLLLATLPPIVCLAAGRLASWHRLLR
jgi:hypothetical protein